MRVDFLKTVLAVALLGVSVSPAVADPIVFNFTGTVGGQTAKNNVTLPAAADDNSSSWVSPYMNNLLASAAPPGQKWAVNVTGAETSGRANVNPADAIKDAGYSSNRHVSCVAGTSGRPCVSDTLSALDNTPFIMTSGAATAPNGHAEINMAFSGGIGITSLSFDFEIFPNGSCQKITSGACGDIVNGVPADLPDFTFLMTSGGTVVEDKYVTAVVPGTGAMTTTSSDAYANYTLQEYALNPDSALGAERAPQFLGTMTFDFNSVITDPTLDFIDWPAAIGVTNISWGLPAVPEPGTMALFGFGLLGLGMIRRRTNAPLDQRLR